MTDQNNAVIRIQLPAGAKIAVVWIMLAAIVGAGAWIGIKGLYAYPEAMHSIAAHLRLASVLLLPAMALIAFVAAADKGAELTVGASAFFARHAGATLAILTVVVGLAILAGVAALAAFPNSGDEYSYLYQAQTFLAGRLWNALPPVPDFFTTEHILQQDGKWVSQYPPGWALIIAAVVRLGVPAWIASPLTAICLLLVFARLAYEVGGWYTSLLGTALLGISAFFVLNGASYFSHVPTALFGTVFVLFALRFIDCAETGAALAAGAGLGMAGLIRPLSAVLVALPFAVEFLLRARWSDYRKALWIAVGGAPFLVATCWYNYRIDGNPFLPVISWGFPLLKMGLHPVNEYGDVRNLIETSQMAVDRLIELAEWTSPLLLALYAAALVTKIARRGVRFYDFIFPVFVVGYLFYPDIGGNRYGPRYYFEAYPFLALTVASAAAPYLRGENRSGAATALVGAAIGAHLTVAAITCFPWAHQFHRIVAERMALYDLVKERRLDNAVVVIRSTVGPTKSMSAADLTRNGIALDGGVLFAQDEGIEGRDQELFRAFPDRDFYVFARPPEGGEPTLLPMTR